jgi:hypothetical protein
MRVERLKPIPLLFSLLSFLYFFFCHYVSLSADIIIYPRKIFFSKVKNLSFTAPYSNSFFVENFYFDFSKIWLRVSLNAKVRENRSFRKHRFKLEDPSSQSFMRNQNLSRYWLFRTARNHKIPHYAKEPIPSKLTNTQSVEIQYPSSNPCQKQKIFKTTHVRKHLKFSKNLKGVDVYLNI